jgi:hypothetical protein
MRVAKNNRKPFGALHGEKKLCTPTEFSLSKGSDYNPK